MNIVQQLNGHQKESPQWEGVVRKAAAMEKAEAEELATISQAMDLADQQIKAMKEDGDWPWWK